MAENKEKPALTDRGAGSLYNLIEYYNQSLHSYLEQLNPAPIG